jgi:hypothetical protein
VPPLVPQVVLLGVVTQVVPLQQPVGQLVVVVPTIEPN